jgi:uncharacterized damage-inducible protein DinB
MIKAEASVIKSGIHARLKSMEQAFNRSTKVLKEEDSSFTPVPGMFTVAQHVAHTAQTIDWYVVGTFAAGGFDMSFERLDREVRAVISLDAARSWLKRAFVDAHAAVDLHSDEEWAQRFAPGETMGDRLKLEIMTMLMDHLAHHRGALTVYSRLLGKIAPNPYMEPM